MHWAFVEQPADPNSVGLLRALPSVAAVVHQSRLCNASLCCGQLMLMLMLLQTTVMIEGLDAPASSAAVCGVTFASFARSNATEAGFV